MNVCVCVCLSCTTQRHTHFLREGLGLRALLQTNMYRYFVHKKSVLKCCSEKYISLSRYFSPLGKDPSAQSRLLITHELCYITPTDSLPSSSVHSQKLSSSRLLYGQSCSYVSFTWVPTVRNTLVTCSCFI